MTGEGEPAKESVSCTSKSLVFFLTVPVLFSPPLFIFFFLRKKQEVGALLRIAVNVIEFLMLFSNKQTIEKLRMEKYKQCFLKCHCTGKHMF